MIQKYAVKIVPILLIILMITLSSCGTASKFVTETTDALKELLFLVGILILVIAGLSFLVMLGRAAWTQKPEDLPELRKIAGEVLKVWAIYVGVVLVIFVTVTFITYFKDIANAFAEPWLKDAAGK